MAFVYADRVQETSTTTGTGTYTLAGAVADFQSFAAIGDGNTCYYTAVMAGGGWEVGYGTYTAAGTTLARTTILASSNAGAAVSWGAGTKTIFCTIPAAFAKPVPHRQVLTSGTTYTTPAGCFLIDVEVQGGGGGGGTGAATPTSGTGGGGGGYARKLYTVTPSTGYTIAVGAGGASTSNGGASTFTDGTTLITGSGGIQGEDNKGAVDTTPTFIGGAATNGDINIPGSVGDNWSSNALGGTGGDSFLGTGGVGGNAAAGSVGLGYGGGGGGGGGGGAPTAGGAGAAGVIIITEYY